MKTGICRIVTTGIICLSAIAYSYGQNDISEPYEKRLNERQPPETVMNIIGIKPGMTIGEIGAGRGRYTVHLAGRVGSKGKIYANDIDETSLAFLRGRCKRLNLQNVETITGEADNPLFPSNSLDLAVMVLVYHMIEKPDNLLLNLKSSLKQGAKLVIVDPRDREIDMEFGIDRSKPGNQVPTIGERIKKSAEAAGYNLVRVDSSLKNDYIFILEPKPSATNAQGAILLRSSLEEKGVAGSAALFDRIRKDPASYKIPENAIIIVGNEFIGARMYPEALAVLQLGEQLYPKSAPIYGTIGEVYLVRDEKENARKYYRLFMQNGPDSLNTEAMMGSFDIMYEQLRKN